MFNPATEQRIAIRDHCGPGELLASVRPVVILAALQEVETIESNTLAVSADELPTIREELRGLLERLRSEGIITPERWSEFFGEGEYVARAART